MSAIDNLAKLEFAGIAIPYTKIDVRGGLRDHTHEYPHVKFGQPEKFGLKNYEITIETPFLDNFLSSKWRNLYPNDLNALIKIFESGSTEEAVIPNMGRMKCYASQWDRTLTAKMRSGEMVRLVFKQDDQDFSAAMVAVKKTTDQATAMTSAIIIELGADTTTGPAADLKDKDKEKLGGLLDDLSSTVSAITAIKDQIDLFSDALEMKLGVLASLLGQLESLGDIGQNPRKHKVSAEIRAAWAASLSAAGEAKANGLKTITYTVPLTMAVGDISKRLYGTTQRGTEILRLNPIDNAFSVPAGTKLRVIDPAVKQAALDAHWRRIRARRRGGQRSANRHLRKLRGPRFGAHAAKSICVAHGLRRVCRRTDAPVPSARIVRIRSGRSGCLSWSIGWSSSCR